ncbi:tetratricopeptide repeat protein [Flavobacterium sp. CYK-55]|uniref:type IX secretion system periplasmic lipoprotein PorW/SprE n=1 Tax=Flavobacterium sp. CYK-55 TaxID=2835529 RepID=UPI0020C0FF42|nr:gliding motility protein [Flavobacterium sp. CYK-55]
MKTNLLRYFFIVGLLFLMACSTKRNTFISRNSHALSTRDNILYNGGLALDKGIVELKTQYKDNFWKILPVERMTVKDQQDLTQAENQSNPNFTRAETKATKAIQKHSMNIGGSEKNPQMDEAHLLLGKARYYDQRFVPALEAFNYVLYKHANSSKINEVKIWREKTNMRLENDAIAVENMRNLLQEIKFKDQIFADANATLAQAFLNLGEKDSAMARLKLARDFTKSKEEKARYRYILGQLFEDLKQPDSAYICYQEVIDMKRRSPKPYVIHAHMRQAFINDFEKGDSIAFLEKYNKLLKDRENRPYLNFINHEIALFYDKNKNFKQAKKYYNISLNAKSIDKYLIASNYRNLAEIFFNEASYVTAGKYYDSTLVQLEKRTREFRLIRKKRDNLDDVIKFEGIAAQNDSIIKLCKMSDAERTVFFENYILKLKEQDAQKALAADKEKGQDTKTDQGKDGRADMNPAESKKSSRPPDSPGATSGNSNFYFYNANTVAKGKVDFIKKWGERAYANNWRITQDKNASVQNDDKNQDDKQENTESIDSKSTKDKPVDERYLATSYLNKIPTSQTVIDSITKERNFAYYQLGIIYKEKFKEYKRAADKLEMLLENKPEERLVLPSMYHLFKIYEIIDKDKALTMKSRIVSEFPDSRYAQILSNQASASGTIADTPEGQYDKLYKQLKDGDLKVLLTDIDLAIAQYTGEPVVPKFELLKANVVGRLLGLEQYKKTLNFAALNYPNSDEGKQAEKLLREQVPQLEALKFYAEKPLSWKILYKSSNKEDKPTKFILDKVNKFIQERGLEKLTVSYDLYTMSENFVVIHGLKSDEYAKGIVSILKEFKEYKIPDKAYIISNENYKIVQIKKNFEEFLTTPYSDPLPAKTYVPKMKHDNDGQKEVVRPRASHEQGEDAPPAFSTQPPGLPGLNPAAPPTGGADPRGGVKSTGEKSEKR